MEDEPTAPSACCESDHACVFAKALQAREATCELMQRRAIAERDLLECTSPVARINCATLAALLHERARFALRLPPPGRPLIHMHSLRLQCGGLSTLRRELDVKETDVHRTIAIAQERHGSLTELPWAAIVSAVAAWQPRKRAGSRKPS